MNICCVGLFSVLRERRGKRRRCPGGLLRFAVSQGIYLENTSAVKGVSTLFMSVYYKGPEVGPCGLYKVFQN